MRVLVATGREGMRASVRTSLSFRSRRVMIK